MHFVVRAHCLQFSSSIDCLFFCLQCWIDLLHRIALAAPEIQSINMNDLIGAFTNDPIRSFFRKNESDLDTVFSVELKLYSLICVHFTSKNKKKR